MADPESPRADVDVAAHRDSYPMGNIHHGTPENPDWGTFCVECKQSWPCDVSILAAERDDLRARLLAVEALEQSLRTFALVRSTCRDPGNRPLLDDYGKGIVRACDDLRAVLASPSTQEEGA